MMCSSVEHLNFTR